MGKYWVVTNLFQGQHQQQQHGQQHQPTTTIGYNNDNGGALHTHTAIAGVPSTTLVRAITSATAAGITTKPSETITSSSAGTLQIPQATQMLSQAAIGQQLPNGTIITAQTAQQQQQRHVAEHQQQQQQQQLHVHGKFYLWILNYFIIINGHFSSIDFGSVQE